MLTPAIQSSNWGFPPRSIAWPGRLSENVSLAVFGGFAAHKLLLATPPDTDTHVLTVSLIRQQMIQEVDGRVVVEGISPAGDAVLLRRGETGSVCVSGPWEIIQYYLPDALVRSVAQSLHLPDDFINAIPGPRFAADAAITRLSAGMARRLAVDDTPSRLELDEIGLRLIEHILRWHGAANESLAP